MNAVTPRAAGAVAALASLKQGLQNVAVSIPTVSGDPYLRMEKDGVWVYGQENVEVEEGSLWAVNPMSFKHGYVCWTNHEKEPGKPQPKNEKLGEVMVSMQSHKPGRETLEDLGWEWRDQTSCQLICTNGTDKGEQVLYNVSSVGGSNEIAELIAAIMGQLDADPDHPVPLVELLHDTYPHKTWGKVYTPVLNIRGWVELTDNLAEIEGEVQAIAEQEPEEKPEPAKPARRRSTPAVKAETKAVEQKKPEPKATEELAQAMETPAERRARLLAELEALEGSGEAADEQTRAATPAEIAAIKAAQEQTTGATEGVRRRRRVS